MPKQPVAYDSAVAQEFADRLYDQARSIVVGSTIKGFFLGLFFGSVVGVLIQYAVARTQELSSQMSPATVAGSLALFIVVAATASGFSRGREKAFQLRLQAQLTLCQIQIEKNTRVSS